MKTLSRKAEPRQREHDRNWLDSLVDGRPNPRGLPGIRFRQRGIVFLLMLVILGLGATYLFLNQLNAAELRTQRKQLTQAALSQAKDALVGDAVSQPDVTAAGSLRLPDLGFGVASLPTEGEASPNFAGNHKDHSVVGRVPWNTLGLSPPLDGSSECVWFALSGRFKKAPLTDVLNWDTQGQIDVIDASGNLIASNLAAMVIAPGGPLDGQTRALADPAYRQCGGNYDARNYLDSYLSGDAVSGEVNYFSGSTNNRVASDHSNKRFVLAINGHYNDRFLFITTDDIFRPILRRNDFATEVRRLLDDLVDEVEIIDIDGPKGTDDIDCSHVTNRNFCENWREMLWATELSPPAPITLDGATTPTCKRVVIFAGHRTPSQSRRTPSEKNDKSNYLEGANLASFGTPTTGSGNFDAKHLFDPSMPSADLARCIEP